MFCYFLNCRKIISKSNKHFFILTVASGEGDVSEFFLSEALYDCLVQTFRPFDYINLNITVRHGRIVVSSAEPALDPLSLKGGDLNA